MPFQIGDRVVCINSKPFSNKWSVSPLKEGLEYTVRANSHCTRCGAEWIDVGIRSTSDDTQCSCGNIQKQGLIWWCHERRFKRVEDISTHSEFKEVTFTEVRKVAPISVN